MGDKRLVLHHTTGPRAGMCEIIGLLSAIKDAAYPPALHYGTNAMQKARHVRTTARMVLYREWAALPSGRFGDEMDPRQV